VDPTTASDAELVEWLARVGAERRQVRSVMAELVRRGAKPEDLAALYGVHRSTVWRKLRAPR
jgi:transcriptional regulator of acetoin/glycerol metabolism